MQSSQSLVSVIVPLHNAEKYISQALASILREKQTAIEVIVINDKSTDLSLNRVLDFRDERIRVISGPGRGIAACLNAGLAEARGAIIMRCDADDLYPEARIRQQVLWLDQHPAYDGVCGSFSMIDSQGKLVANLECGLEATDITNELVEGKIRTHLCTYAIRRSAAAKTGGFREFFETGEDVDFQLRLGEGRLIAYVPNIWYFYRVHGSSITHTKRVAIREFYEQKAYELQRQRRLTGLDDLQRGYSPPRPNADFSPTHTANTHIQEVLLGRAWREHRAGKKAKAIATGLRALALHPLRVAIWRSVIALLLKSPGT